MHVYFNLFTLLFFVIANIISPTYAQNTKNVFGNNCADTIVQSPAVSFSEAPINYKTDTALKLTNYHTTNAKSTVSSSHPVTGMFQSFFTMTANYAPIKNATKNCYYINDLKIHILWVPTISSAKEVVGIPCLARVSMEHEKNHYRIEKERITELLKDLTPFFILILSIPLTSNLKKKCKTILINISI